MDKHIYPTDIDAMIEYKDSKYLLFEVKYEDSVVPVGQRLALQRMVDDFTKTGKQAIVIICTHHISNPNEPIIMAIVGYEKYITVRNRNGVAQTKS